MPGAMGVGGKAKLTCSSAVGQRSARAMIPPDAKLQVEVELIWIVRG